MPALTFTIENKDALPDGGPLTYTLTGRRGIDIGRDTHLDWVLPDPSRIVSGKHCEIRFREGGYWLHDVSSNGTYVNGDSGRLAAPRRLRDGDRLEIGPYVIAVALAGEAGDEAGFPAAPVLVEEEAGPPAPPVDFWAIAGEAAPPEPVGRPRPRAVARLPHEAEVIDRALDLPALPGLAAPAAPEAPPPAFLPPPAAPEVPPVAGPAGDILRAFERGAGLPERALGPRDPAEFAEMLGRMLRLATGELKVLMQARSEAKGAMRSARHTSVAALDNNPIPFAPTAADALRLMLAPPGGSYLTGEAALIRTFEALKAHQGDTFVAMQAALEALLRELAPAGPEAPGAGGRGGKGAFLRRLFSGGPFGGLRKGRLWDLHRARWDALAATHPEGIRGVFLTFFAASYDRRAGG